MGDTTLTVDEEIVEELREYRDDRYHSWSRTLEGMMNMLPTVEQIEDGCNFCGESVLPETPVDERGGVIHYDLLSHPGGQTQYVGYFCSPECMKAEREKINNQVPREPDIVRVGGRAQPISECEHSSFYIDGETREVGFPVPNAFDGYEEEPVYIQNNGQWVQTGIVEEIYQEDARTTLLLGFDALIENLNHPDSEVVEKWQSDENRDSEADCESCGRSAAYTLERPEKCPFCAAEL